MKILFDILTYIGATIASFLLMALIITLSILPFLHEDSSSVYSPLFLCLLPFFVIIGFIIQLIIHKIRGKMQCLIFCFLYFAIILISFYILTNAFNIDLLSVFKSERIAYGDLFIRLSLPMIEVGLALYLVDPIRHRIFRTKRINSDTEIL
ncbi:hypothetical protein DCC35_16650 [Mangrovivirga cuniculi]|uniref:Uncharacterized protein n=1 Tax=Mangrovivirga cuniculi TaxID=2715131 RepID=A0A4D7K642_9BACT|nr:hypothetical protein DCC35_16650 [Mangrovivirga cuniculi]